MEGVEGISDKRETRACGNGANEGYHRIVLMPIRLITEQRF